MKPLSVLIAFIIAFSSVVVNAYQVYRYDAAVEAIHELDTALTVTKTDLISWRNKAIRLEGFFDEFQSRKNLIAFKGYSVDELVVFYLTKKFYQIGFVDKSFVDSVQGKESSFWLQTDGALGEVGGFQLMPSFVNALYWWLEADPTGLYLAHAGELKTNTDLAYFAFFLMKFHEQAFGTKLSWKQYNDGSYLRFWMSNKDAIQAFVLRHDEMKKRGLIP